MSFWIKHNSKVPPCPFSDVTEKGVFSSLIPSRKPGSRCSEFCQAVIRLHWTPQSESFSLPWASRFATASGNPSPSFLLGGPNTQLRFSAVLNLILRRFPLISQNIYSSNRKYLSLLLCWHLLHHVMWLCVRQMTRECDKTASVAVFWDTPFWAARNTS